ncbi:MAG: UbiX family flavin prenyltransferase [Candidatus Hadarchaeum sp.]|uniref:UbiX family flavin prenyltransferase n=1 Tax=Candidatus Hadarchaeum sp. TaxID=2883567 RepID=UPI003D0A7F08
MRLIVALTGASGALYGLRFLEACKNLEIETELIISRNAEKILEMETGKTAADLCKISARSYSPDDLEAPPSSGSYQVDGMVVIPCSMKTLGEIANGISHDLITRAADVTLKQNRRLVLVPRETPLNLIHLENMVKLRQAGAVILPAAPAFYIRPKEISDLVDFIVGRVLEMFGIDHGLYPRWSGAGE